MNPEEKRPYLPLTDFGVPNYKYFPTALINKFGPKEWERLRILHACERLGIPANRWPKIPFPQLPRRQRTQFLGLDQLDKLRLPMFRPLEESIAEWKKRCHSALNEMLDECGTKFEAQFQDAIKQGIYTKIPQSRDTTPLELRYEWAVQRLCYRTPYSKLADTAKGYSEQRVQQSVCRILKKAGLNEVT